MDRKERVERLRKRRPILEMAEDIPVYLFPEAPFWFVPGREAFGALGRCYEGGTREENPADRRILESLERSIAPPERPPHLGRESLPVERLSELWFHLTNACNLRCRHCLFTCRPGATQDDSIGRIHDPTEHPADSTGHFDDSIEPAGNSIGRLDDSTVLSMAREAVSLGCRLLCFTGGEPFLYPGFVKLLERLQQYEDLRIAVLTNGTLIPRYIDALSRLDGSRLHFQVSLDGPEELNDSLRGAGSYGQVSSGIRALRDNKIPCNLVMAVSDENFTAMKDFVSAAVSMGVENVHFMWHLPLGLGEAMGVPPMDRLIPSFFEAMREAKKHGIIIDNVEAVRAQVFTYPGTRFDLDSAGFESLCIGPNGSIFPTPATVGQERLKAGNVDEGLENVWRKSRVLNALRHASLLDIPEVAKDPWRFILGGGDLDHTLLHSRESGLHSRESGLQSTESGLNPSESGLQSTESGLNPSESGLPARNSGPLSRESGEVRLAADPNLPLYRAVALELIREEASALPEPKGAGLRLRMGDITSECPSKAEVNFTHNNCLLSLGEGGTRDLVRAFYGARAEEPDEKILNPVPLPEDALDFIPEAGRVRMYGCGSPVIDALLRAGETLVDLGSGSGVECFIAARDVGRDGRVIGVDMTDSMLDIAERSKTEVERKLGFSNIEFIRGFIENPPLEENIADAVISNCVVNLCHNKRKVFQEIHRILKPGGRLVISDVICEREPPLSIRADHRLTGECISGALTQDYLFALLRAMGFTATRIIRRFPYRVVRGHPYFSLTFTAFKPSATETVSNTYLYGGPFQRIELEDGATIEKGIPTTLSLSPDLDKAMLGAMGVYRLHPQTGAVENAEMGSSCCRSLPSLQADASAPSASAKESCCAGTASAETESCCAGTASAEKESCCSGTVSTEKESCCSGAVSTKKESCCSGATETGSASVTEPSGSCCCDAPDPVSMPPAPAAPSCCGKDTTAETQKTPGPDVDARAPATSETHEAGCLVCREPLIYHDLPEERACAKCGRTLPADAWCTAGHFVCDLCHKGDPLEVIRHVCLTSKEKDLFVMLDEIRAHPSFALHGPEHHAAVTGVILSTYRNLGGAIDTLQIMAGIDRGALVPGGACGFMGNCGAAVGVGVAFAAMLGSNPLRADARRLSLKVTARVLDRISDVEAARCCRRESYTALEVAAELSKELLPITLRAAARPLCDQQDKNKECIGADCAFFA